MRGALGLSEVMRRSFAPSWRRAPLGLAVMVLLAAAFVATPTASVSAQTPAGSLDVIVEDLLGNGVSGVFVEVIENPGQTGSFLLGELTDANGVASFPSVPAGDQVYRVTDFAGFDERGTVSVASGANTQTRVEISPGADAGAVTVSVMDGAGNPLPDLLVEIVENPEVAGSFLLDEITDSNGVAGFPSVPTGRQSFRVSDFAGFEQTGTIDVTAGEVASVDITGPASQFGTVRVVVEDPVGNPLREMFVELSEDFDDPDAFSLFGSTDGNGVIVFPSVPIGQQVVRVTDFAGFGFTDSVVVAARPVVVVEVVGPTGEFGSFDVVVQDAVGDPVEAVQVEVVENPFSPGQFYNSRFTEADGAAFFDRVPVGEQVFRLSDANGFEFTETVTISADTTTSVTLGGPRPSTVELSIVDGAERPLVGSTAVLVKSNVELFAIVDGAGAAQFSDVAAGDWTLRVFGPSPNDQLIDERPLTVISPLTQATVVVSIVTTPGAPTGVVANVQPTAGTVRVAWSAPVFDGDADITGYTATATPGTASCTTTSTTCDIVGLAPGSYSVTVVARNAVGASESSASTAVTVGSLAPGFTGVKPARLVETRVGAGLVTDDRLFEGEGRLAAGSELRIDVAGRGGVPDGLGNGVGAVALNVTAVSPSGPGFLTLYACEDGRPVPASNVNYGPGDVAPNAVLVKVDSNGQVCAWTRAETDLIIDVNGYFD